MPNKVHCDAHGDRPETFVCEHLVGDAVGLGFNRDEPTEDDPYPDAWCDSCQIIFAAHGGWHEDSEKLLKISLLCCECYERTRIRNTKTSVSLADLNSMRWKCGSCEEWHTGPCLDLGFDAPHHWRKEYGGQVADDFGNQPSKTFLTPNYCSIDDRDFFVRGIIQLPILGSAEHFCWGVWGSLSRQNFEILLEKDDDSTRVDLPPMFSWLCSQVPGYPETLGLKMHAHIRRLGTRPRFEVQPTDHPLSKDCYSGISAQRVKDIMMGEFGKYSEPSN